MNCKEFARRAIPGTPSEGEALEHLKTCAACSRLEELLGSGSTEAVMSPDRLKAIRQMVTSDLSPVRAMASHWVLAAWFAGVAVLVLLLGAVTLRTRGLSAIGPAQAVAVFSIAAAAILLAADQMVRLMTPGSLLRVRPGTLAVAIIVTLTSAVATLFPHLAMDRFLATGFLCLSIGTSFATVGLLLANSILRKGSALDRTATGIGAGLFAGAAAFAVQEIYCPYTHLWHVLGFHVPTIGIAIAIGVVWGTRRLGRNAL